MNKPFFKLFSSQKTTDLLWNFLLFQIVAGMMIVFLIPNPAYMP